VGIDLGTYGFAGCSNRLPPNMPAFFDLLREETHPAVRVVLGHFLFVYIHFLHGRERPHRAFPDERDAGIWWIPLDGHTC
jgi:hypothetical protein